MDNSYDYIVIGSGFGGSVAALRLAEKGYDVLVLEKGKSYKTEDFPKTNWTLRKYFWLPALRWFGILKLSFFRKVFILSGTGVGGGSLVYANTHYYPPKAFFDNPEWSKIENWETRLEPFFKKARFMLGTTTNTQFNREDHILKEIASDMGREETFCPVDVGVYFGDPQKETDPYFNGHGPTRQGCTLCGGCMVGCRHNAKNTLDKNYLHFAQKYGAKIIPETKVYKIEFSNDRYQLTTKSSTSLFPSKIIYSAKNIVLAAGVLGTLDLLLKQKLHYKTLPHLSSKLGQNLRTNSESLCGISSKKEKLNNGIAISSAFSPDDHTKVEIVKYSDGSDVMKYFATMAADKTKGWLRPLILLKNLTTQPARTFRWIFGRKWAERSIILLVMQTLDNSMQMVLKKFPYTRLSIKSSNQNKVPAYIPQGQQVMHRYANKCDGLAQNATTEVLFNMSTTAHIIGGCPMGSSIEEGVVDKHLQVHAYPGLHIVDGSVIPCNLGVNPSLTITALAEYGMSHIPPKTGNKNISLEELIQKTV